MSGGGAGSRAIAIMITAIAAPAAIKLRQGRRARVSESRGWLMTSPIKNPPRSPPRWAALSIPGTANPKATFTTMKNMMSLRS